MMFISGLVSIPSRMNMAQLLTRQVERDTFVSKIVSYLVRVLSTSANFRLHSFDSIICNQNTIIT